MIYVLCGKDFDTCQTALNTLLELLRSLGFRINWKKVVNPTQRLVFRGIQLDTVHNTMCLDPPKRQELKQPSHKMLLSRIHHELAWWLSCLQLNSNPRLLWDQRPIAQLSSDSNQHAGGAFCYGDWLFCNWSLDLPHLAKSHINIKELAAIAVALQRWAPALHGHHVVVLTDSTCAAGMLNKGSSSHRTALDLLK